MSMRRLAGVMFAAVCAWPLFATAQAAEAAKAVGNSTLVLELQTRGRSSEERVGILLKASDLIRRHLITEGIGNARVVPVGEDRIVVSAPGTDTLAKVRNQLTAIPKLSFRLLNNKTTAREALASTVPPDNEVLWAVDDSGRDARPLLVQNQELLAGTDIDHAEGDYKNM